MLVKTFGSAIYGVSAITITIEVSVEQGVNFLLVGLPDNAVKESQQRIHSALMQYGHHIPQRRVVINMAPADIRKEGAAYDLPLAIGILAADGQMCADGLDQYVIMGELSLDGSLRPIKGALPIAIEARKRKYKGIILPKDNAREAAIVNNLEVYGAENIKQVIDFFDGTATIQPTVVDTRAEFARRLDQYEFDFADVKGQEEIKRALEIAAAGGHNVILIGPPGSGKTMLAKRLPSILPPLSLEESLETTQIHSVAGKMRSEDSLIAVRPFRAPHHTVSDVALVGGGVNPQPGEISLAHNGVLFLDELPEFKRSVLEVLRQPMEERRVTISRAKMSTDYPASFMLVAAMNPCPCGYYNHPTIECTCNPGAVNKYMAKISGPLMDRIDLHIEVTPLPHSALAEKQLGEPSAEIRRRVIAARRIQNERYKAFRGIHCNAQMNQKLFREYCDINAECQTLMKSAMDRLGLSARAYDRILKVARTIADLDAALQVLSSPAPSDPAPTDPATTSPATTNSTINNSTNDPATTPPDTAARDLDAINAFIADPANLALPITVTHLSEAINYRSLDRDSWGR